MEEIKAYIEFAIRLCAFLLIAMGMAFGMLILFAVNAGAMGLAVAEWPYQSRLLSLIGIFTWVLGVPVYISGRLFGLYPAWLKVRNYLVEEENAKVDHNVRRTKRKN